MSWLALKGTIRARSKETRESRSKETRESRSEETREPHSKEAADWGEQEQTAALLHRMYLADVFSYVSRRVPDKHEAEDVTAEVFASAFAALKQRKGQRGSYPWLLGIARRKIADSYRHRTRRVEQALTDDFPARPTDLPEAVLTKQERQQMIHGLMASLPEDQREALLLHYVEGLSQAEIAIVLKRSSAAVNSLLQRARSAVHRQGRSYFLNENEVNS